MSRICVDWFKNLQKDQQEDFKTYVRNSTQLIDQLRYIIENYEHEIYEEECKESSYEVSDWTYLQAHRNGKKEILRKLKKLTDHIKDS